MPKATDVHTLIAPPLTSGKAALAMLEIESQLSKLGAAAAGDHPDAEFIRFCAGHQSKLKAFEADQRDSDESPFWPPYNHSLRVINEVEPKTIEGLVAKAYAAKVEAYNHGRDGQEDPEGTHAEGWAWNLINDLIRINAAPNPDAELIALCQEFIDLELRYDEMVTSLQGEALNKAWERGQARQKVLAAEIGCMSFKTMEGAAMIARAAACWAKDVIENGFAEFGGLHGDLYFTLVKGLIGEARL
jgi:hypothetical protein